MTGRVVHACLLLLPFPFLSFFPLVCLTSRSDQRLHAVVFAIFVLPHHLFVPRFISVWLGMSMPIPHDERLLRQLFFCRVYFHSCMNTRTMNSNIHVVPRLLLAILRPPPRVVSPPTPPLQHTTLRLPTSPPPPPTS